MGIAGAAIPLGAAAGPPLGGLLLAAGGWQWIFLVNLPLVAAALVLGARAIPVRHATATGSGSFDRAGAVLLTATLVCGAWALNGSGLDAGSAAALGALALLLLAAFVRVELRRPDPVVQPRLFARAGFGAASAGVALSNLAMYVTLLALPVLLARQGRPGEAVAGLVLASMSAASLVVTPLGGRVVDRLGSRVPAVAGLSVQAVSLVPLALWPAEAGPAAMVVCMLVAGTGLGLSSSALQVAAVSAVDAGSAGVASGVFSTSRYAGSIVGTALLAGPLAPADAGTAGFGALFALLAAAAAASAACATRLPGGPTPPARVGPASGAAPAPART